VVLITGGQKGIAGWENGQGGGGEGGGGTYIVSKSNGIYTPLLIAGRGGGGCALSAGSNAVA
jgi:hypothetical protein